MAASTDEKAQGRRDLDQVVKSLEAVDVAYAAGNAAEAQARFAEALVGWNRISRVISAREAREQQLLFDALGDQLKTSVAAATIKSTVTGMLDELQDDIAGELK
jgi:Mg/Co/Ni transporter MgtE